MSEILRKVCVFCGSSTGDHPEFRSAAEHLGRELVRRNIGLVFGGGCVGLMGILADTVLAGGGHAIGVIPHALVSRELAHPRLPDLRIVNSMHERKAIMASLADAFVALPGGFGTFEEFCEAVTWTQLGLHKKRCGLLNTGGYYDPLLALFDRAVNDGFVNRANRSIVLSESDPALLLEALATSVEPGVQWLRSSEET
ncbi:MAG TPA: TIGR00730 family Rossman fold protein [Burkholderiales bacterium]|nr:TIGR00730 family Rossman fold protein [Burkholderiales bacterium]